MPSPPIRGNGLHPLITSVAGLIRERRESFPGLKPLQLNSQLEEIRGSLEGEALFISNELHTSLGLRKLHLEVAQIGSGLQILHCVFFPNPKFDLPIFGVDIVAVPNGISAAIVDISPVGKELPLPIISKLKEVNIPQFKEIRKLPEWGSIFSPFVKFIRPFDVGEENLFFQLVDSYLSVFMSFLDKTAPEPFDAATTIYRYEQQLFYCLQQKRNDKTRSVLEKAFNPEWAERYLSQILFDNPSAP